MKGDDDAYCRVNLYVSKIYFKGPYKGPTIVCDLGGSDIYGHEKL